MIRKPFVILIFTLLASLIGFGQDRSYANMEGDPLTRLMEDQNEGHIAIYLDTLLEENYYKLLLSNRDKTGVPGYRIRIFSESGLGAKEEQQKVRARFLSLYPGIDAYNRYDEPFFKLYVGDCRTRSGALKLYDEVKKNFPNTIIVEDYINL